MSDLTQIQIYLSNIVLIVATLSGLTWVVWRNKFPTAFGYLGVYLILSVVLRLIMKALWTNGLNNLWLLHLSTLTEFIFYSLFFRHVFLELNWFKKNFNYFLLTTSAIIILNSILFESIFEFNTNARSLVQVLLILYVILYFFDAFGKVDFADPINQSTSLVCFGVLVYYSGSLFIFMFGNLFFDQKSEAYRIFWVVNAVLSLIFQILIFIAILQIAFQKPKAIKG